MQQMLAKTNKIEYDGEKIMKKFLAVLLATTLCLALNINSYAYGNTDFNDETSNSVQEIIISSEDEILDFLNSENYMSGIRYSFYMENPISTRAICYMCGKPGLGLGSVTEDWSITLIPCPANEWESDRLNEFRIFQVERCTTCGHELKIKQTGTKWAVECESEDRWYDIIPGATMEDGYDPHQCIVP